MGQKSRGQRVVLGKDGARTAGRPGLRWGMGKQKAPVFLAAMPAGRGLFDRGSGVPRQAFRPSDGHPHSRTQLQRGHAGFGSPYAGLMDAPLRNGSAGAGKLRWAGFLLGFSLGGFFDGILLHQVLQWHHLLSNVQAAALQDIRAQMLADGLFHVLMYFIAAWALYLLWKARADYSAPGADRVLWARALIGFGVWHIVDSVVSHWITGIHRIRVDSPNPLFWDLLWFTVFGIVPLVIGWLMQRSSHRDDGRGRKAAASLAVAALIAGLLAALPAGETDQVLVIFRPGMEGAAAFNALAAADARVLWVDRSGGLWAVSMPEPARARALYAQGALLVSNSALALGCFTWSRTSV